MAEILHFEILRKHGQTNTQTHKQTHKHTNRHGHYNTSPSPCGGRGNNLYNRLILNMSNECVPVPVSDRGEGNSCNISA